MIWILLLLVVIVVNLLVVSGFLFFKVKKLKTELTIAYHDPLTKILNRGLFLILAKRLFDEVYQNLFRQWKHRVVDRKIQYSLDKLSVIFLDLDYFKQINDNFGHEQGDLVLAEFANLLIRNIRSNDLVGRWGGDEFVVLLRTDKEGVKVFLDRLREELAKLSFSYKGKSFSLTISAGSRELCQEADSLETLIDLADKNLYVAKKNRNCYVIG